MESPGDIQTLDNRIIRHRNKQQWLSQPSEESCKKLQESYRRIMRHRKKEVAKNIGNIIKHQRRKVVSFVKKKKGSAIDQSVQKMIFSSFDHFFSILFSHHHSFKGFLFHVFMKKASNGTLWHKIIECFLSVLWKRSKEILKGRTLLQYSMGCFKKQW